MSAFDTPAASASIAVEVFAYPYRKKTSKQASKIFSFSYNCKDKITPPYLADRWAI